MTAASANPATATIAAAAKTDYKTTAPPLILSRVTTPAPQPICRIVLVNRATTAHLIGWARRDNDTRGTEIEAQPLTGNPGNREMLAIQRSMGHARIPPDPVPTTIPNSPNHFTGRPLPAHSTDRTCGRRHCRTPICRSRAARCVYRWETAARSRIQEVPDTLQRRGPDHLPTGLGVVEPILGRAEHHCAVHPVSRTHGALFEPQRYSALRIVGEHVVGNGHVRYISTVYSADMYSMDDHKCACSGQRRRQCASVTEPAPAESVSRSTHGPWGS